MRNIIKKELMEQRFTITLVMLAFYGLSLFINTIEVRDSLDQIMNTIIMFYFLSRIYETEKKKRKGSASN